MKKYRNKIIVGAVIAVVLSFSFWYGGSAPGVETGEPRETAENGDGQETDVFGEESVQKASTENSESGLPPETESDADKEKKNESLSVTEENISVGEEAVQSCEEQESTAEKTAVNEPTGEFPEDAEKTLDCTMSIRCDTLLQNMQWLDKEKAELVPKNGIIYEEQTVSFYEGESIFNLLMRETRQNKIHMEYTDTPGYSSAYIEGIANIYEYDCGELSGWMYKVNGQFPNYGSSKYKLHEGDRVEWVYTCDLGRDVGGEKSARNGR